MGTIVLQAIVNRLQIYRPVAHHQPPLCAGHSIQISVLKKHKRLSCMKRWERCPHQLWIGRPRLVLRLREENEMLKMLDPAWPLGISGPALSPVLSELCSLFLSNNGQLTLSGCSVIPIRPVPSPYSMCEGI